MWAKSQHSDRQKHYGFTIVELLIVVVVIAILAAITIVAYNGIQNRAKQSAAQSTASQAGKKIATYAALNSDAYPSTISDDAAGVNLPTDSTSYQYRVSTDKKSYCLTTTTQGISYYVSNTNLSPTLGACAGHGANGAVVTTNLIPNPSAEINTAGFNYNNTSSKVEYSSSMAYIGTASLLVTSLNTTSGYNGVNRSIAVTAGKTYTFSAWVYLNSAYGSGVAATTNGAGTSVKQGNVVSTLGAWTRTSVTFSPTSTTTASIYVITPSGSTAAANASFYTDAWMFTEGPDLYQYGDGNTNGWIWDTGTAHASTSTGPAL